MDNVLGTNLKHLRKFKGLTQDQFADKIGINRAMVGSYEEGRAIPKISVIQNMAHYFNVSIDQLINSDLDALPGNASSESMDFKGANLRIVTTIVDRDNSELITLVPVKASAGYLNGYADPDYVDTLPRFALPLPELSKERTYRAFQIKGESMEPIPSGAYVISEYVQDWQSIKDGNTYILITRDEGVVYKRVFLHSSGELWLKSDNPQFEAYTVHLSRLLEIWKAVGYICTSLPEPDSLSLSKLSALVFEMKQEINELKGGKRI
jgi:transcriptional regulator with XRE-family HTH domain